VAAAIGVDVDEVIARRWAAVHRPPLVIARHTPQRRVRLEGSAFRPSYDLGLRDRNDGDPGLHPIDKPRMGRWTGVSVEMSIAAEERLNHRNKRAAGESGYASFTASF
jgi:hypothetical protein